MTTGEESRLLWLGLAILLACILIGARVGGIGLGAVSGLGPARLRVRARACRPGIRPAQVLGMIIAVITALSVMQAAGGLDYLLELAEDVLRRQPGARHGARAARDLCADLRVGNAARDLRAAADHRGGVAQGRHPAGAAALGQRDRGAAGAHGVAGLGGHGRAGRRALGLGDRPAARSCSSRSRRRWSASSLASSWCSAAASSSPTIPSTSRRVAEGKITERGRAPRGSRARRAATRSARAWCSCPRSRSWCCSGSFPALRPNVEHGPARS